MYQHNQGALSFTVLERPIFAAKGTLGHLPEISLSLMYPGHFGQSGLLNPIR